MQKFVFLIKKFKCLKIKSLNVKVFNLMSRTNETRYIEWHETCKCECKFRENVCNNEKCWNKTKCRCECKELLVKGVCDKGCIWNPGNCECECDKACDVVNIQTMKIVRAEKNQLTKQLMNS